MIRIYQGNSTSFTVEVVDDNGAPAIIASYTGKLYIKKSKNEITYILDKTGDVTDNVITFSFTTAETNINLGQYVGEVVLEAVGEVITVLQFGLIIISQ